MAVYKRMDERFTGTTIGHGSCASNKGRRLFLFSFATPFSGIPVSACHSNVYNWRAHEKM